MWAARNALLSARPARRWIHATRACLGRVPFKLSDIGEGIVEVEVLEWFVKPGDTVKQFDKIALVASDKASVEITSRYDGVVEKINWEVGDMAQVGSTLVELEVDGVETVKEDDSDHNEAVTPAAPEPAQQQQDDSEMVEIVKPPPALERLGSFTVDPVIRPASNASEERSIVPPVPAHSGERVLATPAVRRLAKDHNLDLSVIPATGPGGRLLKGDVLAYIARVPAAERQRQAEELRQQERASAAPAPASSASSAAPAAGGEGAPAAVTQPQKLSEDVAVPVRGVQRMMVKSMTESLLIPHFNFMEEYEMTEMVEFRSKLKAGAEARGLKLSYMPIMIKAASLALVSYPGLNAHINKEATEVVHKASHNIALAMDTPRGLLVPVIKDCQEKSILDIAQDLVTLQRLGADNKLGEAELTGGTFTLSNIGAIGGTYASPVIPAPTVVIGAVGKIQTLPRFVDETNTDSGVYAAKVMNISWAADHRVVDGATLARYSNQLKSYLENPLNMISDLS